MLTLSIKADTYWDAEKEQFVYIDDMVIKLEHSLLSISEWEAKYHKPFLSSEKTVAELYDYIWFMYSTVPDNNEKFERYMVELLTNDNLNRIKDYLNDPQTATKIVEYSQENKKSKEYVTNELIYYWMSECQIPFIPCESWNISRLLTLIRVCTIKRNPPKKHSMKERYANQREINRRNKAYFESLKNKAKNIIGDHNDKNSNKG